MDRSASEDDDDVDPSSPLPDDAPHLASTAPNLLFDPFAFPVFEGAVAVVVVVVVMATTVVVVVVVRRGTGRLPPTSRRWFTPTVPALASSLHRIF
jgi:hypothetical protein